MPLNNPTTQIPMQMPAPSPMQPTQQAQLHDIIAPPTIDAWWPLAPGWWVLIALLLIGVAALCYWLYHSHQKNAYRRQALQELEALKHSEQNSVWLQQLNQLLKRTAHSAYPSANVASLHGQQWQDFIQSTHQQAFDNEQLSLITQGGYQPEASITNQLNQCAPTLIHGCHQWIMNHPAQLPTLSSANPLANNAEATAC